MRVQEILRAKSARLVTIRQTASLKSRLAEKDEEAAVLRDIARMSLAVAT